MNRASKIESFQSITGATQSIARLFLSSCSWNVERSISLFFDNGGVPPATTTAAKTPSVSSLPSFRASSPPDILNDYRRLTEEYRKLQQEVAKLKDPTFSDPSPTDPLSQIIELPAYKPLFDRFDPDNTGQFQAHQLQDIAFQLGAGLTSAQAAKAAERIAKGDGTIPIADFFSWWDSPTREDKDQKEEDQSEETGVMHVSTLLTKLRTGKLKESITTAAAKLLQGEGKSESAPDQAAKAFKNVQEDTAHMHINIKSGTFDEVRSGCLARCERDPNAVAKSMAWMDQCEADQDAVVLSLGFVVREDIGDFQLGELSGTLKDILQEAKADMPYSAFKVHRSTAAEEEGTTSEKKLLKVSLIFSKDEDETTQLMKQLVRVFHSSKVLLNLALSAAPSDDLLIGSYESEGYTITPDDIIKMALDIQLHIPKAAVPIVTDGLLGNASLLRNQLALVHRLANVNVELEFDDLGNVWDDITPTSLNHLRNWASLRPMLIPDLSDAFADAPPPVSVAYFDIVEKLEALHHIQLYYEDFMCDFKFTNFDLCCLPTRADLDKKLRDLTRAKIADALKQLDGKNAKSSFSIAFMGPRGVGKTTLIRTAVANKYASDAPFRSMYRTTMNIDLGGRKIKLALLDTPMATRYTGIGNDVVVFCFSISDVSSFVQLDSLKDVNRDTHLYRKPALLVGLKSDEPRQVSVADAKTMAVNLKAQHYLECSAKTGTGIANLLVEAARAAMEEGS